MRPLTSFDPFWQAGPPKKDPLDAVALLLVLLIVWRLVGGC
jgi:hypothetical protein